MINHGWTAAALVLGMWCRTAAAGNASILTEDFSGGMADWYVEGGRGVEVRDGRLMVDADPAEPKPDGSSGDACTVWNRMRIAGDLRIEFEVMIEHSYPGKNNINFFLFYTMPDGTSPEASTRKRRDADYADYHRLNGYIFTFVNARNESKQARIRIRRCPGFRLLSETFSYSSQPGHLYRIAIVRRGGTLEFFVDGELRLSAHDDAPLTEGYFGFRTFQTRLWFDNLTIRRLDGAPTPD
jgi:hypothetical protein